MLDRVPGGPRLVVATPGAEPIAEDGYAAALLLDAWALLERTELDAAEQCLRRWIGALSLVRPRADGGVGVHTTIWHDVLERPSLRRVEVFCERRHIVLENDWTGPVAWTTSGQDTVTLEGAALEAEVAARGLVHGNADGAFIRAVRGGGPAWPSFDDAVRAHRVVDAIYASAAAGGSSVPIA